MTVWFVQQVNGEVQTEIGPLQPKELLELVRKGSIRPETKLRKGDSAWFPASDVGGLFEAASRRPLNFSVPVAVSRFRAPRLPASTVCTIFKRGKPGWCLQSNLTSCPQLSHRRETKPTMKLAKVCRTGCGSVCRVVLVDAESRTQKASGSHTEAMHSPLCDHVPAIGSPAFMAAA